MSTREITQEAPGFVVPYTVPAEGLTSQFRLRSSVPLSRQRLRLFNVSKAKRGPIRDIQVMEILVSANNRLVIETSGFGPEAAARMREQNPQFPDVIKGPGLTDGEVGAGLNVVVGLQGRTLRVVINGRELTGSTFLAAEPGEELNLSFGFPNPPAGDELLPPVGWTVELPDQEEEEPEEPSEPEQPVLTEWQQSIERRLAKLEAALLERP